jgi:DNA-binding transcriptional regulator PaaX
MEGDWKRRQAAADAMVNFLEGWVVADLCSRFKTVVDAIYSETFEFQLVKALLEDTSPQSLQLIASKCGVSRTLMLPERRLRRAIERMERAGLIVRTGAEERPRYSLDRSNLTCHLLEKLYEKPRHHGDLISASLGGVLGSTGY